MFELARFKCLIKKYKTIFSDILGNMQLEKIENDEITFKNEKGEILVATIMSSYINFTYKEDQLERRVIFRIPDKNNGNENIKVFETVKETRPNGCIIERIEKIYGFSRFSLEERVLLDIVSKRYAFSKNVDFIHCCSEEFLESDSLLKTVFESHMKTFVKPACSVRWYTDSSYSSKTLLNSKDISSLYDIIEGKDKIGRIYDLYNGVINKRNSDDIYSIHLGHVKKECFGYKETSGITKQENEICGKSKNDIPYNQDCEFIHDLIRNRIGYKEIFDCSNLKSLLHAITYQKTSVERAKETIEKELGVPYDEFDQLDYDEQHKLLQTHKVKKQKKDNLITMMIGSGNHSAFIKAKKGSYIMIGEGEHSCFVEAGLTPEEEQERINKELDKIVNENKYENIRKRILNLLKK